MALSSRAKARFATEAPPTISGMFTKLEHQSEAPWQGDIWGATKAGPTLDGLQVTPIREEPFTTPIFASDSGPTYL